MMWNKFWNIHKIHLSFFWLPDTDKLEVYFAEIHLIFKSSNWNLFSVFFSLGTGSLTVLRQNNTRKLVSSSSSRTSSTVSVDSDSYASAELGLEKMPAADAPDASHFCSMRWVICTLFCYYIHTEEDQNEYLPEITCTKFVIFE